MSDFRFRGPTESRCRPPYSSRMRAYTLDGLESGFWLSLELASMTLVRGLALRAACSLALNFKRTPTHFFGHLARVNRLSMWDLLAIWNDQNRFCNCRKGNRKASLIADFRSLTFGSSYASRQILIGCSESLLETK